MGGVHDLLAAEVPDVQPDVLGAIEADRPLGDGDALGLGFARGKGVVHQAVDQGGLAHITEADQDQLGLVERAGLAAGAEVVVEDVGRVGGLAPCDFLPCRAEQLGRQAERRIVVQVERLEPRHPPQRLRQHGQPVAVEIEVLQSCELPERFRQRGQSVAGEVEGLQLREPADRLRQRGQLVAGEGEHLQLRELPEGLRQRGQLVVGQGERSQLRELPERLRQRGQLVVVR